MMLEPIVPSGVELPMPDYSEILRELREKRRALQQSLSQIDAMIRNVEAVEGFLKDPPQILNFTISAPPAESASAPPRRVRGELSPDIIANYAREILLELGTPLKRGELVRALESRGVPLPGTDKNKNLGTILWRHSDKFVNLEKLGYWPKDTPLLGVYEPSDD